MDPLKDVIRTNETTNKTFSFSKGNVSLNFTLRIDIKQDLKDFRELLAAASAAIDRQLESMKKENKQAIHD